MLSNFFLSLVLLSCEATPHSKKLPSPSPNSLFISVSKTRGLSCRRKASRLWTKSSMRGFILMRRLLLYRKALVSSSKQQRFWCSCWWLRRANLPCWTSWNTYWKGQPCPFLSLQTNRTSVVFYDFREQQRTLEMVAPISISMLVLSSFSSSSVYRLVQLTCSDIMIFCQTANLQTKLAIPKLKDPGAAKFISFFKIQKWLKGLSGLGRRLGIGDMDCQRTKKLNNVVKLCNLWGKSLATAYATSRYGRKKNYQSI